MPQKREQKNKLTKRDIEQLLKEQTVVILSAVDSRLERSEKGQVAAILSEVDERLEKFGMRFNRKLDQLMTTLDRFLKRLTDSEDEFVIIS